MQRPAQLTDEKRQVCEIFEQWADHYATERERTPYFRAQLAIVLSMLAGQSGRILDIGCAAGGEIPELRARGFSVVGIDISPRMLEFARHRFASDPQVHLLPSRPRPASGPERVHGPCRLPWCV